MDTMYEIGTFGIALLTIGSVMWTYHSKFLDEKYQRLIRMMTGLKKEMELISAWAKTAYPDSSVEDYKKQKQFFSFWLPTRLIFKPDYSILRNLKNSEHAVELGDDIIGQSISLTQALDSMYQHHSEYRNFVFNNPGLLVKYSSEDSVLNAVLSGEIDDTSIDKQFLDAVYGYNYTIHCDDIGNSETKPHGLHNQYKQLKETLDQYEIRKPRKTYLLIGLFLSLWGAIELLYVLITIFMTNFWQIIFTICNNIAK